jgi:hypothetical protein
MRHEMRKEIDKFKGFLKENSEEKLNISDIMSDKNQHLLIVHHESGDEIHFNVIDYSLYPQIDEMINDGLNTQQQVDDMLDIINNNTLEHLMCQTYVLEDYTIIGKYNILKCIYLPELGY